ncbi:MAG TPA: hypothetical protein VNJ09_11130 [Chthonomonadales bacterium]|nr:hypothetical protein [Chthonomonadales bacterium]
MRRSSMKAASRSNGRVWGLIRSFFFWVFLLVASFAVGALIIAPLYNAYTGSRSEQGAPAATSAKAPTPSPPPVPQSAVAPPPVQKLRPESQANFEPDIQITPDEPETSVQPAESPDESRPRRRRSRIVPRIETPTVEPSSEPSPNSRSIKPEDTFAREEPAPGPEHRVTRQEQRNSVAASEGERERNGRPRRRTSEERISPPRATAPSGDIQTPEKIDP